MPLNLPPSATREELLGRIAVLDHQVFDLQSLLKAGEALFNELDVGSLCRLIIAMAHERSGMDQIAVILHDRDRFQMKVVGQRGLSEGTVGMKFPVVDGILWRLLRSGESFTVVNTRGEPRFPELFRNHKIDALGGLVWVPLVVADRVVGVISLGGEQVSGDPLADNFKFSAAFYM